MANSIILISMFSLRWIKASSIHLAYILAPKIELNSTELLVIVRRSELPDTWRGMTNLARNDKNF